MSISFKTRDKARSFHAIRRSKGFAGRLIDNGADFAAKGFMSRYAVSLH